MDKSSLVTIKSLLDNVSLLVKKHNDIFVHSGNSYNIFDVLGASHDELSHSKMIAHLLCRNANHGQSDLFLKLFISNLLNLSENDQFENDSQHLEIIKRFNTEKSTVSVEKSIGNINDEYGIGGRMDILISDGIDYIIIENKIYAQDQKHQLVRYKNFKPNQETPILYLTLQGNSASKESKSHQKINLVERKDYLPISYEKFISNWLDECIHAMIDKPFLRETIRQYQNLIKELTNQSTNKIMSQELAVLLAKNYSEFKRIKSVEINVYEVLINQAKDSLQNLAKKHSFELSHFDLTYNTKWTGFIIKTERLSILNLDFCVDFDEGKFSYGLIKIDPSKEDKIDNKLLQEKFNFISTAKFNVNTKWPFYAKLDGCSDFNKFFELVSENNFESFIEEIIMDTLNTASKFLKE